MKRYKSILIFAALLFAGFAPHAYAEEITPQFPITVDPDKSEVHYFDVYHGETVLFEVTFKRPSNETMTFFWQEQGMGDSYWSESCTTVGDGVYRAVFTPQMDTGAKVFNCFIGRPGMIYRAVFQLRMKQSPGALPNALPLPTPVIDFARIHVLNPPWGSGGGGCDSNAVAAISNRVDSLETAADSLASSVSGLASSKIDKVKNAAPVAGNFAALTADGGIKDSRRNPGDFVRPDELDRYLPLTGGVVNGVQIGVIASGSVSMNRVFSFGKPRIDLYEEYNLLESIAGIKWYYGESEDPANEIAVKGDISATNPTFSNAVATVARTVTPPPSPTLRLYDEERQCYWIGRMINGVINWEVE